VRKGCVSSNEKRLNGSKTIVKRSSPAVYSGIRTGVSKNLGLGVGVWILSFELWVRGLGLRLRIWGLEVGVCGLGFKL